MASDPGPDKPITIQSEYGSGRRCLENTKERQLEIGMILCSANARRPGATQLYLYLAAVLNGCEIPRRRSPCNRKAVRRRSQAPPDAGTLASRPCKGRLQSRWPVNGAVQPAVRSIISHGMQISPSSLECEWAPS
jgi:hypothetical protein